MGFSRQESLSGLSFPPPGHLPDPGIKPKYPALAGGFFPTEPPGKTIFKLMQVYRLNSALHAEILDSNVLTLCTWTNTKKATCTSPSHNPSFCPLCTVSSLCIALIFFPSLVLESSPHPFLRLNLSLSHLCSPCIFYLLINLTNIS